MALPPETQTGDGAACCGSMVGTTCLGVERSMEGRRRGPLVHVPGEAGERMATGIEVLQKTPGQGSGCTPAAARG